MHAPSTPSNGPAGRSFLFRAERCGVEVSGGKLVRPARRNRLSLIMASTLARFRQPLLVRITYVKNANKAQENVRTTLRTLGFTKLNQSLVHKNVLPVRGM